jgi:hypothetical protein
MTEFYERGQAPTIKGKKQKQKKPKIKTEERSLTQGLANSVRNVSYILS